jgi:hypothetical protein
LMIIMVDITWNSLKKKLTKSTWMNEAQIKISKTFSLGTQNLKKQKKSFQKNFWELGSFLILQKSITTIWLRIKKRISHLIILFHF